MAKITKEDFKEFSSQTLIGVEKCSYIMLQAAKILALVLGLVLLVASVLMIYKSAAEMLQFDDFSLKAAIQDGLFVLILLEMMYVVFSFLKYGSVNVSLVINIGIIATIKQLIFKLDTIDLYGAISFAVLIIGLGAGYVIEMILFERKSGS